jgi:uncharacterized membrane protein YkoI
VLSRRRLFWLLLVSGVGLHQTAALTQENGNEDSHDDHSSGEHESGGGYGGGHDDGGSKGKASSSGTGTGEGSGAGSDSDDDQNLALDAVKNGNAASLKEVLDIVNEKVSGEVVHVSLTRAGDNITYSIRLLDASNTLVDVQVNAISRTVILANGL